MRLVLSSVAVVALLVGCSPGAEEAPSPSPEPVETTVSESPVVSPSPSPTTESPSPTPTPTPSVFQSYPADLPTEDPESAAIIEGWQEYQRVLTKFSADPLGYSDFSETQQVTAGDEMTVILDILSGYREDKVKILGDFSFSDVSVSPVDVNPSGDASAVVTYCVDRSRMRVVTYDGVQEDTSKLSPTYEEQSTLLQGADDVWRVAQVRNDQDQPC